MKNLQATLREAREAVEKSLHALRSQIAEKQTEIARIEDAPVPLAEAKRRIHELIDGEAARFNPDYRLSDLLSAAGGSSDLLSVGVTAWPDQSGTAHGNAEIGPLMAWLFGDEVKARLEQHLKQSGYEAGLTPKARAEKVGKLRDEIRALEIEEEALVVEAEEAGLEVYRRPDADPLIVLEAVEVPDPLRKKRELDPPRATVGDPITRAADGAVNLGNRLMRRTR